MAKLYDEIPDDDVITVGEPLPRIASVAVLDGFRLRIEWDRGPRAGETETIDVGPAIFNHRAFIDLRADRDLFERVAIGSHGSVLVWPGEVELAAEWIDRLPRAEMTNDEFRAIMDGRLHYTLDAMAAALGIARRRIADYRKGTPVPRVVALATRQLVEEIERKAA